MNSPLQRLQSIENAIKETLSRHHTSTASQQIQRLGDAMIELIDVLREPFRELDHPAQEPVAEDEQAPVTEPPEPAPAA